MGGELGASGRCTYLPWVTAAVAVALHSVDLPYWASFLATELFYDVRDKLPRWLRRANEDEHEEGVTRPMVTHHQVGLADIDRNFHMNNARFLRATNFVRRAWWRRRRSLWRVLKYEGLNLVITAQSIRYRGELRLWQRYRIESRLVSVVDEEMSFFMEFSFVTGPEEPQSDGRKPFVNAVQIVKYRLVPSGGDNADVPTALPPTELLRLAGYDLGWGLGLETGLGFGLDPSRRPDIMRWRESIRESSRLLRTGYNRRESMDTACPTKP